MNPFTHSRSSYHHYCFVFLKHAVNELDKPKITLRYNSNSDGIGKEKFPAEKPL